MQELNECGDAIKLAMEAVRKYKDDNGCKDEKTLEIGDTFVIQLRNATLILGMDYDECGDRKLRTEFLGDLPLQVDISLSIYEG